MNVRQNVFRAVLRGLRRREGAAHGALFNRENPAS